MNIIEIIKELLSAWREGSKNIRRAIIAAIVLAIIAGLSFIIGEFFGTIEITSISGPISVTLGVVAGVLIAGVLAHRQSLKESESEQKLEEAEKRVQEHPHETKAAWELARVKLESYLNRNLKQVRSIFWLTVFVMLVGFSLIGFGIYKVFVSPEMFEASIVAAASGIVVNFIGATFLILYRSTMAQATNYVTILERINAVGMSVQILETISDEEDKLKQQTTADIAKQLLVMYSEPKKKT
jgi:hypothetical protein